MTVGGVSLPGRGGQPVEHRQRSTNRADILELRQGLPSNVGCFAFRRPRGSRGADLPLVADPVITGTADLMLGRRTTNGRGAWPLHARIGNRVLAAELRRRINVPVHDLGPMRAARRADLLALALEDRRFGYPLEMVVRAAEAGWWIQETAVPYHPRTGKSKVTGTVRGTVRAVRDMRRVLASISPAPAATTTATRVPVTSQAAS